MNLTNLKNKNMSVFKKCQILLLPTNEKAENCLILKQGVGNKKLEYHKQYFTKDYLQNIYAKSYHLYILSDEEIKESDWFYYKHFGEDIITQAKKTTDLVNLNNPDRYFKKIIASTDSSLLIPFDDVTIGLPQIHQSFIEYYVDRYNRGNIITEVMVEYNDDGEYFCGIKEQELKTPTLKINPDNTINIKPIKDNLKDIVSKNPDIREEIINLIYELLKATGKQIKTTMHFKESYVEFDKVTLDKWIEENI